MLPFAAIPLLSVILGLSPPPATALAPPPGFEQVAVAHGVTVYRRKGAVAIELVAQGEIEAPPARLLAVLTDYGQHARYVDGVSLSQILKREPQSLVVYQRLKLPLISNRDFTLRARWWSKGDTWMLQ